MTQIDQAIILAAGLGKRLHPLTLTTPKPLLPIQGQPIIKTIIDRLQQYGIHKIIVNTHYLAEHLESYLASLSGVDFFISYEPVLLETGGAIINVLPKLEDKPFFVLNADIWWQESTPDPLLKRLERAWDNTTMDALLAMIPTSQALGFSGPGDYYFRKESLLQHRGTKKEAPYIFSGVRLFHPRLFNNMKPMFLPQLILFHQAEARQRLHGLIHPEKWCDIGTLTAYRLLQEYLSS